MGGQVFASKSLVASCSIAWTANRIDMPWHVVMGSVRIDHRWANPTPLDLRAPRAYPLLPPMPTAPMRLDGTANSSSPKRR